MDLSFIFKRLIRRSQWDYVVTETSSHDQIATETVITQILHPYKLGDEGCINTDLQRKRYEEYRIAFWIPSRKNQKHCPLASWERWLKRKRKAIETVFSILADQYRITDICANSISGFEVALPWYLVVLFTCHTSASAQLAPRVIYIPKIKL